MLIVNERYNRLRIQLSQRTRDAIKHKAQWEKISLSAVVYEWPDILPKRLRKLAKSCFVETEREWLAARIQELERTLAFLQRRQAKLLLRAFRAEAGR